MSRVVGRSVALLGLVAAGWLLVAAETAPLAPAEAQKAAMKLFQEGHWKEAYDAYRQLGLDPKAKPDQAAEAVRHSVLALANLGRTNEFDEFVEAVVAAHPEDWFVLQTAAQAYLQAEHYGFIIAGKYERGGHRGGGKMASSIDRDRVRALQLYDQALAAAMKVGAKQSGAEISLQYAEALQFGRASWELQVLTDLTKLPDYEEGQQFWWGYQPDGDRGVPVDAEGQPVLHALPKTFAAAISDGERWRFLLVQAAELDAKHATRTRLMWADFLHGQFGVQTLRSYGTFFFGGQEGDHAEKAETGAWAVHTLKDNETIAKLATGVKRFTLPDEFNPVKLFRDLAYGTAKDEYTQQAADRVAGLYEDRRQYPKAAEAWREAIKKYGQGPDSYRQKRLEQIVKNWGRFEPVQTFGAGKGPQLEYRFRNGTKVLFEAYAIDVPKLLADLKAYLKGNPGQLDWNKLNIGDLGSMLVWQNQNKYFTGKIATWQMDLKPRPEHFDDRVTVQTPLQKAGAYLVTAKLENGNVGRVIVWINDTVLIKKQLEGQQYYFVADAVTGKPVAKANVEFFGWRQEQIPNTNKFQVLTTNFSEFSDADGQLLLKEPRLPTNNQWLITARTDAGRLAYLGFTNVWYQQKHDPEYNQVKSFFITDRPVYRPTHKVEFKAWIGTAKYDQEAVASHAGQDFHVLIHDPQGNAVYDQTLKTDEFGGLVGQYELPKGCPLGQYSIIVEHVGGSSFRVEEYKKPEFEVTIDAPQEPVMLGEQITATIHAKYLFGAPVTQAKVKYKVLRSSYQQRWYPPMPWDWFYGSGYWWFASDYTWYPGWHQWGCWRPIAWWWYQPSPPPEVVMEQEVAIGADGIVKVTIDTALAKEMHGDEDHKYSITAEVTDASRRMIVGQGDVLVARQPFKVFAWVDRGHYQAGDVVEASFSAHTLDQKPVPGKGKLTLYKVSYNAQQVPVETEVESWDLDTDVEGRARQQFKAAEPGQYRIAYKLTDAKEHVVEGAYVFTVIGPNFDGQGFRFNDLELITDKREYAPGEKVRLMINTNRTGGTVLLFLRPTNGVYLAPQVLRLDGKSTVQELDVTLRDMPNFFVEAVTISGNKLFTETREVVVPPEKRVLNVSVEPSQSEYLPGAESKVKIKLTDLAGKPFAGSTVVSVYDKAVEYISGGTNVPEIKEFFWKWRRHHQPQTESTLDRSFYNLLRPNEVGMSDLGAFGDMVLPQGEMLNAAWGMKARGGFLGGMGGGGAMPMAAPAAAEGMPSEGGEALMLSDAAGTPPAPPGQSPGAAPTNVRTNFADTAFWAAAVTTNNEGVAEVSFKMPENLTGWKVKVWGMGLGTKVGEGSAEVTTKKNLLLRLQAPRFFVQKDEVVLSANIHNYLKSEKAVQAVLELDGDTLAPMGEGTQQITIPAGGEHRVDWRVKVNAEGEAVVRMKALSDEESDAMEVKFPVYVHGILKVESFSGVIRPNQETGKVTINVPEARRINDSRLEVRYSPSLAGALVDALPYLLDYPYGCTEQTLNRFVPAVITQSVLRRMNLDLKAIAEKRTNLNAQEIGDDKQRAAGWKRFDRNPVFEEAEMESIVKAGLDRLTAMQLSDGGWGWFSGYGEHSWPHTTAVVIHGLQSAVANDLALVPGVLENGVAWLQRYQAEEVRKLQNAATKKKPWKDAADDLDAFIYMVLVESDVHSPEMLEFLYRDRKGLSVYSLAMYGIALKQRQEAEKLETVLRNIEQYLMQDDENQTAYLKLPNQNYWWAWYGSEMEAHAYYLKLLTRVNPQDERASRLVKYILNNRKHATYWNSTRDTALCIEALAEYMKASGEAEPDLTLELFVDGKKQKEVQINKENLFTFDNQFVLFGDAVETGKHEIELRKKGAGPVYFNAYLTNFTLEDFITKAGLEVKVERKFYKLTRDDKSIKVSGSRGQALDQKVEKYIRTPIPNDATLTSGDLIEIELEIESKNDYEYLVFEDLKAAGCEPMEVRSGYNGNDMGAYVEFRDEKVCFFIRQLARGKHSVSYRLRAEIPGKFSALPTKAYAMYAPELKGNSDEMKISIKDAE